MYELGLARTGRKTLVVELTCIDASQPENFDPLGLVVSWLVPAENLLQRASPCPCMCVERSDGSDASGSSAGQLPQPGG